MKPDNARKLDEVGGDCRALPAARTAGGDERRFQHAIVAEQIQVIVHAGREPRTERCHHQVFYSIEEWERHALSGWRLECGTGELDNKLMTEGGRLAV